MVGLPVVWWVGSAKIINLPYMCVYWLDIGRTMRAGGAYLENPRSLPYHPVNAMNTTNPTNTQTQGSLWICRLMLQSLDSLCGNIAVATVGGRRGGQVRRAIEIQYGEKCLIMPSCRILMSLHLLWVNSSLPVGDIFTLNYDSLLTTTHRKLCTLKSDPQRDAFVLFHVGWLPAGSHHMSPLLGPALPLPGPPWPPAHIPQAAEREKCSCNRIHHAYLWLELKGYEWYYSIFSLRSANIIQDFFPALAFQAFDYFGVKEEKHPVMR